MSLSLTTTIRVESSSAEQIPGAGHSRRKRNGRRCVADIEMVVFGFFRIRIARIVPETRIVDIAGLATREHLVCIALVQNVENELVPRRIENAVQRDFRFDGSEVRPEMPAYLGKPVEKGFANSCFLTIYNLERTPRQGQSGHFFVPVSKSL